MDTVTADANGMITALIRVPVGDAAGTYVITATGMSADGALRVDSTLITVAEPGGGTPPAPPGGGGGGGSGH